MKLKTDMFIGTNLTQGNAGYYRATTTINTPYIKEDGTFAPYVKKSITCHVELPVDTEGDVFSKLQDKSVKFALKLLNKVKHESFAINLTLNGGNATVCTCDFVLLKEHGDTTIKTRKIDAITSSNEDIETAQLKSFNKARKILGV
jgi:hypothetical protein